MDNWLRTWKQGLNHTRLCVWICLNSGCHILHCSAAGITGAAGISGAVWHDSSLESSFPLTCACAKWSTHTGTSLRSPARLEFHENPKIRLRISSMGRDKVVLQIRWCETFTMVKHSLTDFVLLTTEVRLSHYKTVLPQHPNPTSLVKIMIDHDPPRVPKEKNHNFKKTKTIWKNCNYTLLIQCIPDISTVTSTETSRAAVKDMDWTSTHNRVRKT